MVMTSDRLTALITAEIWPWWTFWGEAASPRYIERAIEKLNFESSTTNSSERWPHTQ